MSKYNNIEEEIDAFLNHNMSQEEEQQFKTRINNSPELAEEVRLQKIVVASLQLLHREQTMERFRKNTTLHDFEPSSESPTGFQRFKYWILGFIGLLVFSAVCWVMFKDNTIPEPLLPSDAMANKDSVSAQEKMVMGKRQDSLNPKNLDLKINFPETGQNKIKFKKTPSDYSPKIGTSPIAADIVRMGQKIDAGFEADLEQGSQMSASSSTRLSIDLFKGVSKLILVGTTQSLKEALDTLNKMNKAMLEGEDPQEFYLLRGYTHFKLQQFDAAYADFDRPELNRSETRKSRANLYKWLCLRANYEQNQSKADDLEKGLLNSYKTKIAQYLDELDGKK